MKAGSSRKAGNITSELQTERKKKGDLSKASRFCRSSSVKGKHMKPKAAAYGEYDVIGGLRRYLSLVLLQDGAFNILDGKEECNVSKSIYRLEFCRP